MYKLSSAHTSSIIVSKNELLSLVRSLSSSHAQVENFGSEVSFVNKN